MENGANKSAMLDEDRSSDSNCSIIFERLIDEHRTNHTEEQSRLVKNQRIKHFENRCKFSFTMQMMEVKVQDLEQENQESSLLNLQYQDTLQTFRSTNSKLKSELEQLRKQNRELTDKVNEFESKERGVKRKTSEANEENNTSSSPSSKRLDSKTESTKSPDRSAASGDQIFKLRQNNIKLLAEKSRLFLKLFFCFVFFQFLKIFHFFCI